jgi:hypothetical protein
MVANARVGSNHPDYWAETQILSSDVACSHQIPVSRPLTRGIGILGYVSLWTALAPVLTHRIGARGVTFFLHIHLQAHGWQREVEHHQCTLKRIEALLVDRNEPIDGPEATD